MKIEKFFEIEFSRILGRTAEVALELIDLDDLGEEAGAKPECQREYRKSVLANMLKSEFNPIAAGFLAVNVRKSGKKMLLDGQHRRGLLEKRGIGEWPCIVVHGLDAKEEAQCWLDFNRHRSNPNSEQTFRAAILAREPAAVSLANIVKRAGFRFPFDKDKSGIEVRAIAALKYAMDRGIIEDVLGTILAAWKDDPMGVHGSVLRGLIHFISVCPSKPSDGGLDRERLILILSDPRVGSPSRILGEAERTANGRSDIYRGVACEIQRLYNKGLRSGRIDYNFRYKGRDSIKHR